MKKLCLFLIFIFTILTLSQAQTTTPNPNPNPTPAPGTGPQTTPAPTPTPTTPIRSPKSNVPSGEPYEEGEFPEPLIEIQRAEIVAIGTFPFAFIISGIIYDWTLYVQNNFDNNLTPWPGGTGTSTYTGQKLNDKNLTLITASIGISLAVALADYLLGLSSKKKPEAF